MSEVGKSPTQICLEVLRMIYDRMLEAFSSEEDRKTGCRRALEVYRLYEVFLEEVKRHLKEIEDLKKVYQDCLETLEETKRRQEGGSVVVKRVPCGKRCSKCPHGPYKYRVTKVGGKQIWKYEGKADQNTS